MKLGDRLSAFINEKSKFVQDKKVKRKVFEPRDGATSVFVTTSLKEEEQIWNHADAYYSVGPNAKKAIARGDLTVQDVLNVGKAESVELGVVEDEPPPLHANIVGFPAVEEHERLVAEALARKCREPIVREDSRS